MNHFHRVQQIGILMQVAQCHSERRLQPEAYMLLNKYSCGDTLVEVAGGRVRREEPRFASPRLTSQINL
ncbi:hypothetical protein E2C01_040490 [Portunus trituberculatus]|uniref:Uncharacterized protein n=1 Tax=Portunus trituberculatus TaxID=210409 RepID=A0A5B7FQX9_PORTR|nr:hypothetical protein [Portunus trituberculatus]